MKLMSCVKGIILSTYYINYLQSPSCIANSHSAVTCPTHFVPTIFAVFSSSLCFTLCAKCSAPHPFLRHPQYGFLPSHNEPATYYSWLTIFFTFHF